MTAPFCGSIIEVVGCMEDDGTDDEDGEFSDVNSSCPGDQEDRLEAFPHDDGAVEAVAPVATSLEPFEHVALPAPISRPASAEAPR